LLQRQVEADHGIAVQVVVVGDCELDEALRALLDAAREATVNAAKWSGADQVSVFAEVEPDTVQIYVRDRGQGFDRAAYIIPPVVLILGFGLIVMVVRSWKNRPAPAIADGLRPAHGAELEQFRDQARKETDL